MTTREFYESIGASYDNVLVRFGSEKMITKFAKSQKEKARSVGKGLP